MVAGSGGTGPALVNIQGCMERPSLALYPSLLHPRVLGMGGGDGPRGCRH